MTAEIIPFPRENQRLASIRDNMDEALVRGITAHSLESIEYMSEQILSNLTLLGYDISHQEHIKDLSLVLESLKSYIMKYYGVHHPIHRLAEDLFELRRGTIYLKLRTLNKISEPNQNDVVGS